MQFIGEIMMTESPQKFAEILTRAVRRAATEKNATMRAIQKELGLALGRDGGSAIDFWQRGHIPPKTRDIELLATKLAAMNGFRNDQELHQFLKAAGYSDANIDALCLRICFLPQHHTSTARYMRIHPTLSPETFVVGIPVMHPRQFFGRQRVLKRIFNLFSHFPLQNVAVIGPSHSGKTSLLNYIRDICNTSPDQLRPGQIQNWLPEPERYRWISIDFRDSSMRDQSLLLEFLMGKLDLPHTAGCTLSEFMIAARNNIAVPTIILMDEVEDGLSIPELSKAGFWRNLRSLAINGADGNLAFVIACRQHPSALYPDGERESPFANIIGHACYMEPLEETDARELIASSPNVFPPTDVEWILEQSRCWPAILQMLCHERLSSLGEANNHWKENALRQMETYRSILEQKP